MMPELYSDVDITQSFTFLDKELRDTLQVMGEEHNAAKIVDTLVEVPLKSGKDQWVLLHIEVQGQGGEDISLRMVLYCCLIFAHYRKMPVALAILTDKRPSSETPGQFEFSEYGTELLYKYNVFEVYGQNDEELLTSENPFDSFIYAAKKYGDYMSQDKQRVKLEYLMKITRSLQALGLNTKERAGILVLVSRLINLEDTELRRQYIEEMKGENEMAEMNWLEEFFIKEAAAIAEKRGRSEGWSEGRMETMNAAIDFMRSNGMSNEQINTFRNSILN